MTINKFSEFGRICDDQGLDLVLESRVILCGMPSYSSVVLTSGINIVSFWIWRSSRPCGNDRNPIVLDQYGEQFSIGHRKCVVHFGPFPFLDCIPVRTFAVNENQPRGLGHTLVNEDDS